MLLLEHFNDVIQNKEDIERLKKTLLELGIRGKLTKHFEDDDSVKQLLKNIHLKKDLLISSNTIRKGKKHQAPNESEFLFNIPNHWEWVRLSDIGQIVGGGTPKTKEVDFWTEKGNGIPWVTPADIGSKDKTKISRGKRDITELGLKKSSAQLLPKGSVLFSSRAPIGYVVIAENDICTNQGFKSVLPFEMEMNKYIFYYLKWIGEKINNEASGTTFKEVSGTQMEKQLFPLPPLEEQKRIVNKIDDLFGLCNQLIGQIEIMEKNAKVLRTATLNEVLNKDK